MPDKKTHTNKVTCGISMSLDGFVAGPDLSFEKPFGDIPENYLHHWRMDEPAGRQRMERVVG